MKPFQVVWPVVLPIFFVLTCFAGKSANANERPEFYFYPAPYKLSSGNIVTSPETLSLEQTTTKFSGPEEMAGPVLLITWNTLCPTENSCDFSIVDGAVAYWEKLNKKIVLGIATIGFPEIAIDPANNHQIIVGATPDWVMKQIHTEAFPSRVLGSSEKERLQDFPDVSDKKFLGLSRAFIKQIAARYDGNKAIAYVRIATGLLAEDNAMYPPMPPQDALVRNRIWFDYSRQISRIYAEFFKHSQLEFDIGKLSAMYVKGTPFDKESVNNFVDDLLQRHVFLAFDGLDGESARRILASRNGKFADPESRSLTFLIDFKNRGGKIGLEAYGWLSAARMADTNEIISAIELVHPDRLVFFSDFATAVSSEHEHPNSNASQIFSTAKRH